MSRKHAKLNQRRWALTRRAVFEQDHYRCTVCHRLGRLEAHHLHRLRDENPNPYDINLIATRCRTCHVQEHRPDDMTAGRSAWLAYIDGLARP